MYIDLNVPIPAIVDVAPVRSKKNKGKQPQQPQKQQPAVSFTPAQLSSIEARIELLVYCRVVGYTVFALNQTAQKRVDPKTHVNILDPLLSQLRKRSGVAFLKRLTIVLDEDSDKGFGLTTGNASLFAPYDLIALLPTTAASFSLACLSHTSPSPLTAHIISLPLTLPRLPFNLKHTMVRTALKNGTVFEVPYAGALGAESDTAGALVGGSEGGSGAKRNWWAAAREVVRVTKGKGIIVTGGVMNQVDLRAPRDIGNLITLLGLPQNLAHDASTKIPQSLILRAQTRKTYRAVFSEPTVIIPEPSSSQPAITLEALAESIESSRPSVESDTDGIVGKKRARPDDDITSQVEPSVAPKQVGKAEESLRKKKKAGRGGKDGS
ncbi:uncharacterized protein PHACADRAFT_30094 [Phanerochaete carnosa HHB-10118-sp]|uniref:PHP domain-like protein n=1 Tax=Phanerochaete carnosa (strain HHB-10118-sp) TaxID=650164 RepID=K5W256_PHACS|nr:uncharacterized protein PHACADRAFT_30094 [Phanerochaete carnosa HHB-10118-sp]EKM52974.1 hypothetical protein PHACADRAFT_30094 [Phanerochaete carnosa HHB-10118-sp]